MSRDGGWSVFKSYYSRWLNTGPGYPMAYSASCTVHPVFVTSLGRTYTSQSLRYNCTVSMVTRWCCECIFIRYVHFVCAFLNIWLQKLFVYALPRDNISMYLYKCYARGLSLKNYYYVNVMQVYEQKRYKISNPIGWQSKLYAKLLISRKV